MRARCPLAGRRVIERHPRHRARACCWRLAGARMAGRSNPNYREGRVVEQRDRTAVATFFASEPMVAGARDDARARARRITRACAASRSAIGLRLVDGAGGVGYGNVVKLGKAQAMVDVDLLDRVEPLPRRSICMIPIARSRSHAARRREGDGALGVQLAPGDVAALARRVAARRGRCRSRRGCARAWSARSRSAAARGCRRSIPTRRPIAPSRRVPLARGGCSTRAASRFLRMPTRRRRSRSRSVRRAASSRASARSSSARASFRVRARAAHAALRHRGDRIARHRARGAASAARRSAIGG